MSLGQQAGNLCQGCAGVEECPTWRLSWHAWHGRPGWKSRTSRSSIYCWSRSRSALGQLALPWKAYLGPEPAWALWSSTRMLHSWKLAR